DPLDPYVQLVMGAPPSPDYIPGPEAPPSPDYIPGPEYPDEEEEEEHLAPTVPALALYSSVSASEETKPFEEGDDDANDDGDDLLKDDADDEDEEESSDSEEEEEEHLAPTVPALALYSSVSASEETKPFEEGETTATPPPFGYRVAARISIQPHILMPFCSDESIPEADIPLRKRARFTTPTSRYEIGESSVAAAAARQIRTTLTIADKRRVDNKLIGRLRRERRYFRTMATTYAREVAHSRDY
nr:hypothetical protein [Tanacetum cinerariifolium]